MKTLILLLLVLLSGCASTYTPPVTQAEQAYPMDPEEARYAVKSRVNTLPMQRQPQSSRSFLTTGIMGYNLYRNISNMTGDMVRSELRARADAMVANPSELFNPLY